LAKLGRSEEAAKIFGELVERGNRDLERGESADFFAKFGEQETRQMRAATAHYTIGLGQLGLGNREPARAEFEQAVRLNRSHVWAKHEWARTGTRP
jgi:tetratricopeptide (TPR) repeat protein